MSSTMQLSRLTAIDRCDGCGAQAYVQVWLADGAELLFCAHHAKQHEAKLRELAIAIHDETNRL
jgi:Zn ribbon nucleic-acid-binding protein